MSLPSCFTPNADVVDLLTKVRDGHPVAAEPWLKVCMIAGFVGPLADPTAADDDYSLTPLGMEALKRADRTNVFADDIARAFHESYERQAPDHGYQTRERSAVPWKDVPEDNKSLMVAVVNDLIRCGYIEPGQAF
jgi:hypothetical protein